MTDGNILDLSSILIATFIQQCSEPFNCGMQPIEDPSGSINTVFCENGFAYLSPEPPDEQIIPEFDRIVHVKACSSNYQMYEIKNKQLEEEDNEDKIQANNDTNKQLGGEEEVNDDKIQPNDDTNKQLGGEEEEEVNDDKIQPNDDAKKQLGGEEEEEVNDDKIQVNDDARKQLGGGEEEVNDDRIQTNVNDENNQVFNQNDCSVNDEKQSKKNELENYNSNDNINDINEENITQNDENITQNDENKEEMTKEPNANERGANNIENQESKNDDKLQALTEELKNLTESVADIIINEFSLDWGIIDGQPPYLINCNDSVFIFSDDLMPFSMYFNQILLFIGYESALSVTSGHCITPNRKCIGSQLSVNRQKFEIFQIQKFFQPIMKSSSNSNNNNDLEPDLFFNDNNSCATEDATLLSSDASDKFIQYIIKRLCLLFPQMMMSNVPCCSHCFMIYSRISLSSPTQSTKNAKNPRKGSRSKRTNYSQCRASMPYTSQASTVNYDRKSSYAKSRNTSSTRATDRGRQTLQMTSYNRNRNQRMARTFDDSNRSNKQVQSIIPATTFEPFQKTQSGLTVIQNFSQQTFKKSYRIYSSNPFPAYMQHP